ncbi:short-chain fatty acyl-CoA regulator family protein [Kutzneria sp. NPDC051319]|uniref:short-chain fatty acyl-CoA regulator family protein n=1 Tax=Kutzneria sp. NPDC051319 TaxID=3155047 RepID=UPI0034287678
MEKTFAGARLRRLRDERGMRQADLARLLGISASYLNQIEHDSRPLTVPVLVRITEAFGVDAGFFAADDAARLVAELREALPVDRISPADLRELAASMPEVAEAVIALHRRGRSLAEQVEALAGDRAVEQSIGAHEQVRDFFYRHRNHFPELDAAAESIAESAGVRPGEVRTALSSHLSRMHGVRVVNAQGDTYHNASAGELHHYDAAAKVLHLSIHLRPGQQAFRMGTLIAQLEFPSLLDDVVAHLEPGPERALVRIGLARYAAAALILPYRAFHETAERLRYDIELLADHFAMGYETICHRLTTLQRPGQRGVPFSFVRVDRAGNVSKRQSATGFHFSRSGGTCPLWNVYEAFAAPGKVLTQVSAMPDGQRYLWIARTVARSRSGYGGPGKTFAVGLGCEIRHASRLVYSAGMDLDDVAAATPIGPGCRTCDRPLCPQRSAPPIGRPLRVDENRSTFVPYPV